MGIFGKVKKAASFSGGKVKSTVDGPASKVFGSGRKLQTPLKAVGEWASQPQYALSHAIDREFKKAGKNLVHFGGIGSAPAIGALAGPISGGIISSKSKALKSSKRYPSQTKTIGPKLDKLPSRYKGIPVRGTAKFATDIVVDPLTWVAPGAGASARAGSRAGSKALIKSASSRHGITSLAGARAAASSAQSTRSGASKPGFYFRFPMSFGKLRTRTFEIGGATKLRDKAREFSRYHATAGPKSSGVKKRASKAYAGISKVSPSQGGSREIHGVYSASRHAAAGQRDRWQRRLIEFDEYATKTAGKNYRQGLKEAEHSQGPLTENMTKVVNKWNEMTTSEKGLRDLEHSVGINTPKQTGRRIYIPHEVEELANPNLKPVGAGTGSPSQSFLNRRTPGSLIEKSEKSGSKYITDPVKALERRIEKSLRLQERHGAERALTETFEIQRGTAATPTHRPGSGKTIDVASDVTGKTHRMPEDVGYAMQRENQAQKYLDNVRQSSNYSGGKHLVGLQSIWKGQALASPRRIIRDAFDDELFGGVVLAGKQPLRGYRTGGRVLKGKKGTLKTPEGDIPYSTVKEMLPAMGATRQGVGSEIRDQLGGGLTGTRNTPMGLLEKVVSGLEDRRRAAAAINLMKQGDPALLAGQRVGKGMIDYQDISPLVAQARNYAVPFATFITKSAPQIGKIIATRPGAVSRMNTTFDHLQQGAGNPDLENLPPWMPSSFGMPANAALQYMFQGSEDDPLAYNPALTFRLGTIDEMAPFSLNDDNQAQFDPLNTGKFGMQSLGPAFKLPAEGISGYDFFKEKRFDETSDPYASTLEKLLHKGKVGGPLLGTYEDAEGKIRTDAYRQRMLETAAPIVAQGRHPLHAAAAGLEKAGLDLAGAVKSDDPSARQKASRWFTGIDARSVDTAEQLKFANKPKTKSKKERNQEKKTSSGADAGFDFDFDDFDDFAEDIGGSDFDSDLDFNFDDFE